MVETVPCKSPGILIAVTPFCSDFRGKFGFPPNPETTSLGLFEGTCLETDATWTTRRSPGGSKSPAKGAARNEITPREMSWRLQPGHRGRGRGCGLKLIRGLLWLDPKDRQTKKRLLLFRLLRVSPFFGGGFLASQEIVGLRMVDP